MIRKLFFWTHLIVGVAAALVLLTLCITGALLAFDRQIIAAIDAHHRAPITAPANPAPVDLGAALARLQQTQPGAPSAVTIPRTPTDPIQVQYGRERMLYLHPYTGELLGESSPQARAFFHSVLMWHRWLALGPGWRETGRALTGAGSIAMLFLMLGGLYIWVPKKLKWSFFRPATLLNLKLKGRARDWNWHNVAGIWSFPFMLVLVLTALLLSYPALSDLVLFRMTGNTPPPRRGPGMHGPFQQQPGGRPQGDRPGAEPATLAAAAAPLAVQPAARGEQAAPPAAKARAHAPSEEPRGHHGPPPQAEAPGAQASAETRPETRSGDGDEHPRRNHPWGEGGNPEWRKEHPEQAGNPERRHGGPNDGADGEVDIEARRRWHAMHNAAEAPERSADGQAAAPRPHPTDHRAERAAHAPSATPNASPAAERPAAPGAPPAPEPPDYNRMLASVRQRAPQWTSISLRPAAAPTAELTVYDGLPDNPMNRLRLTLDTHSGQILREQRYADDNLGLRLRAWVRSLHTGAAFGFFGELLAFLSCLAGVLLVYTGLALSIRRLLAWLRDRAQGKPGAVKIL